MLYLPVLYDKINVLLKQADGAITKAVSDGDMTPEDAATLSDLLEQSATDLTPANLNDAVAEMAAACTMFAIDTPL